MRPLPKTWAIGYMLCGTVSGLTEGTARTVSLLFGLSLLAGAVALDTALIDKLPLAAIKTSRRNPAIWLLTGYGLLILQSIWISGGVPPGLLTSLPAGLLVASAAIITHRGMAISPMLLGFGLLFNLGAGVLLGFAGSSTVPCRTDKCSPIGALYKGGFGHENTMGFAAMLVAVIFLSYLLTNRDRWALTLSIAGVALVIAVAAGARSSLFAGVATFASVLVLIGVRRYRLFVAAAIPVVAAIAGIYLIHTATVNDFSTRGRRWVVLRDAVDGVLSPFGNGLTAWADLQPLFAIPTSTHSAYGSLLVHGGLLAVAAFTLFLVSGAVRAARANSFAMMALVTFIAFQGIMESVWDPSGIGDRSWVLIAIALTLPSDSSLEQRVRASKAGPGARIDLRQFDACSHGIRTSSPCLRCMSDSRTLEVRQDLSRIPRQENSAGRIL